MKAIATSLTVLVLGAACTSLERDRAMDGATRVLHEQITSGRTPAVQYRHFTVDSVVMSYDEGLADVARGVGVTSSTTFHGLSITKTATAAAVLQLVDRGLVELDRPAADYLPDFAWGRAVTVRQLLAHSAGIPNPLPLRWIHLVDEHAAFDARSFFAPVLARNAQVKAPPDRRFRYSNLGYVLLGQIVEQVSGEPYERYLAAHVLAPLGLGPADLGFDIDPATHATGYHRRRSASRLLLGVLIDASKYLEPGGGRWQAFRPYHVNGAAYGGLVGTADGFARYARALLDPASGLLSDEMRSALFTEHRLSDGSASGMSLSWFRGELDGHEYYAHAGGGGGFYAELRIYPALGRGSVILFNRSGFSDARFLDAVDRPLLTGILSAAPPAPPSEPVAVPVCPRRTRPMASCPGSNDDRPVDRSGHKKVY